MCFVLSLHDCQRIQNLAKLILITDWLVGTISKFKPPILPRVLHWTHALKLNPSLFFYVMVVLWFNRQKSILLVPNLTPSIWFSHRIGRVLKVLLSLTITNSSLIRSRVLGLSVKLNWMHTPLLFMFIYSPPHHHTTLTRVSFNDQSHEGGIYRYWTRA